MFQKKKLKIKKGNNNKKKRKSEVQINVASIWTIFYYSENILYFNDISLY